MFDSFAGIIVTIFIVIFGIGGCLYGYPKYQVYSSDLAGLPILEAGKRVKKE